MKTLTTTLGFEYDVEVTAVSNCGIDYTVTCDEGEIEFINEPIDMNYATRKDIQWYNNGTFDRDDLVEYIEQFEQIDTIVNEMMLAVRN